MKTIRLISEQDYAIYNTDGFYKVADLRKVSYDDLVTVFGEPTFINPYADEKVNFEWCFQYGDQFYIHAFGQTYTYDVRSSRLWWATQSVNNVFQHKEHDWVTLLTCETYNPFNGDYFFRRAVSAVLLSVK